MKVLKEVFTSMFSHKRVDLERVKREVAPHEYRREEGYNNAHVTPQIAMSFYYSVYRQI